MINGSGDWEAFGKSSIWADILEELHVWLEEIRSQLESEEIDLGLVKSLRGSAKAIRHVMELPGNLKELAIAREQEEKNGEL